MTLKGNTFLEFLNNTAENGGAISILISTLWKRGTVSMMFIGNIAQNGGAISIVNSKIVFSNHSITKFINNKALDNGGAIHLKNNFIATFHGNSSITFTHNTADRRGGAIYAELTQIPQSKVIIYTTNIYLYNNTAVAGPDVYLDIPTSCDEICLNNSVVDFTKGYQVVQYIITPPSKLEFYKTATCIDDDIGTNCQIYIMKNIMLGQEIVIDACVLDYYGNPAGTTLFLVTGENLNHRINGPQYVLVSCKVFQGISVIGKKISSMTNFTMTITSHDGSKSDLKTISVQLILKLSPCHPGFHYDNYTCVCYSDSDIVSCSGSTSSIKRGYWFGEVDDKATVTVCPNNYCNFACCETANGYYELSPLRTDQCNLQRSGIACGNCEDGYTLSFDSVECVSVSQCATGQTTLIVTLSIIYWLTIVIPVFIMTYYHVGIGYLYAITYYYSVVDILLSDTFYTTQGLFITVSIMSSIAKVTPQFLGQLCLVQNMSGIDQQFIHYVHPLVVTVIVSIICLSARISYRISAFVSRELSMSYVFFYYCHILLLPQLHCYY